MQYVEFQSITTDRLILRKLKPSDVQTYFARIGSSPEVTQYMLWDPHKDISESEASIQKALRRYAEGKYYRWGIALKADNALIGVIELLKFDEKANTCSFAYMLGKDFWGQGYGTEAVEAAFRFAFTQLQVDAIVCDHFADNPASGAVMQKAGMTYIGTIPAKYEKHGIKHDAIQYRITASQWWEHCIRVRPAKSEDVSALGTIMSRSFQSAFSGFISEKTLEECAVEANCIQLMKTIFSEGKMRFLLGMLYGQVMGELVWSDGDTPGTAEIQAIHSLPESWGTGLGAAMLQKALADMASDGKQSVFLWAFKENKRARRFYEKHGFTFTGESRTSEFDNAIEVRYSRNID